MMEIILTLLTGTRRVSGEGTTCGIAKSVSSFMTSELGGAGRERNVMFSNHCLRGNVKGSLIDPVRVHRSSKQFHRQFMTLSAAPLTGFNDQVPLRLELSHPKEDKLQTVCLQDYIHVLSYATAPPFSCICLWRRLSAVISPVFITL